MTKLSLLIAVLMLWASFGWAQPTPPPEKVVEIFANSGEVDYFETNGMTMAMATNGVIIKYGEDTILSGYKVLDNQTTGDIFADGSVRLQRGDQTWVGEHLHYNFKTSEMNGDQFRTGKTPFFAQGESLHGERTGNQTNAIYTATNGLITTDDYSKPFQKIRAKQIRIVPGKYFEARNATFYVGEVPVFYLPYYRRSLEKNQSDFVFIPGYRGVFGPYLLSSYHWVLNDELNGVVHADGYEKRGFGTGPDFNYNLGTLGEGTLRTYYIHDLQPGLDPFTGLPIQTNRYRVYFNYDANLQTNLTVKSQVGYQSDAYVVRDFFESQYTRDIQPNTFVDADKFWPNWSLDAQVQPRVNPFWESVERLPEVNLWGFRQQILDTPLYYESVSSIGYFDHVFSSTNMTQTNMFPPPLLIPPPNRFAATRADTFHQITMPETLFGWLNVTPRVGGRYTYYSSATGPGATTTEENRTVFNTGAEISFKASRVWQDAHSDFWDVSGLRHIIEPSLNYAYVPQPNVLPSQVPQFDYALTNSLQMLPIDFPDYNAIDTINSLNTIRFGLNNRFQTKRNGEIQDLADWSLYMDWNLRPNGTQATFNETTFSDIFSSFTLRPRTWLTFSSDLRFSINQENFNLAQNRITFQPNNTWSWTVGNFFLRSTPSFGIGNNLFTSLFFYRFNENWGTRIMHYFDATTGTLREQDYSIYRDLRSWTAAITFRELNGTSTGPDYGVAVTFSLKAFPRFGIGQDTVTAAPMVGY